MKPAWDKLSSQYADSTTVIVADVDCTVHKGLCGQYGVRGYPTIKYFTGATAADGDKYEGGRDFDSLKTFIDENLGPSCNQDNRELCDEAQLAQMDEYLALTDEAREALIAEKADAMAAAEQLFKDEVDKLTKRYEQLGKDKDATIASLTPDLRLLRGIQAAAPAEAGKDEL